MMPSADLVVPEEYMIAAISSSPFIVEGKIRCILLSAVPANGIPRPRTFSTGISDGSSSAILCITAGEEKIQQTSDLLIKPTISDASKEASIKAAVQRIL